MKFKVTFKTPNAVEYGLLFSGAPEDGLGNLDTEDEEVQECLALSKKYIQFGECVTIEFDTQEQTAKVLSAK